MTDLVVTSVGDTWANSAKAGQNYGSVKWVQVQSGSRYAFVRPHIGSSIAGRTVVDAYLVGRSQGTVAQTLTIAPVTEKWSAGQLTWNNQPAVNTAAQVAVAVPALAAGASFELTGLAAMLQSVADGTDYYGFRITTNYATSPQRFYSSDSGEPAWELHIEFSDAPEQPTDLRPDGGAVSDTTPTLAWTFLDLGGDSVEQASFRIQMDTPAVGAEPDGVTPDLDTGYVAGADPQYTPTYAVTGAGPHFWRVQVRDATPKTSDWSDWAEFTYVAAPTLIVDSPTGPFGDPSPTVTAHLSTGTLSAWQAMVTGADRSDIRARSGLVTQAGGTIAWSVPLRSDQPGGGKKKVFAGSGPWWLHLRAWDSVDRATAVGQQPYMETWVQLTFADDLGVQAPTGLLVGPTTGSPVREWSWERTEAPDAWVVTINGDVAARLEAEDVTVDAGRYTWTDQGHVAPLRPQVIAVHAIEGNIRSAPATVTMTPPNLPGVWLVPDDTTIAPIVLEGTSVDDWTREDFRATYTTSTGRQVDITYGQPGRVGSFAGTVDSRDGDVWATLDRVEALRRSVNRDARLVWASHSVPVRVRDIDATASGNILPSNLEHVVRFGFVELDD